MADAGRESKSEDPFSLEGRRVWITGASRGLGRSIATAFARAGARVAVTSRSTRDLDLFLDDHPGTLALPASVADPDEVRRCAGLIEEAWGGLDALVNAAGVSPTFRYAADVSDADWANVIDINLSGSFYCCREAGRLMSEGASMVNISSIHGQVGMPRLAAYSASKGGVEALTRTLALEFAARGIRVNCLAPGYFETDMTSDLRSSDSWRERLLQGIPMGRFGLPDEVVPTVLFLSSPLSSYMTGSLLTLDGGWTAH